ncbi:hypothetical protein L596_009410 [Steinernema carpocapsae]|uniref:Uncharacterized protein n=1 Tax=Steinernema carpocapsae TaxID=34508 RepID=A0A4U5PFT1_STECR|nr:hypothetical protein L596_009410 [Steinernema carpocapsae]
MRKTAFSRGVDMERCEAPQILRTADKFSCQTEEVMANREVLLFQIFWTGAILTELTEFSKVMKIGEILFSCLDPSDGETLVRKLNLGTVKGGGNFVVYSKRVDHTFIEGLEQAIQVEN